MFITIFLFLFFLSSSLSAEIQFTINDIGDLKPIKEPIKGYADEINFYPNPYKEDKVLLTIDSNNYYEYKDFLTAGQIKMFESYPLTFKMNIFPSQRSCAIPDEVLELSQEGNAKLIDEGEGIEGVIGSIPFTSPSEPLHHVWNHILRYRGVNIQGGAPYYLVEYTGNKIRGAGEAIAINYWNPFIENNNNKGLQGKLMSKITHPPRLADAGVLVIESLNAFKTPRRAWIYSPATRRVRRAPDISYDNYNTFSQGLTTVDSYDGFNGAKDRYDWSNVATELKFMAYNNYDFYNTANEDLLIPFHINQDFIRYELVRVNTVRAELKEGKRHILPYRTMYFDYDSHNMLAEDVYDSQMNIIRHRELPIINFYEEPMCLAIHAATYDFVTKKYLVNNVRSTEVEKVIWRLEKPHDERMFTPEGFKRWAK